MRKSNLTIPAISFLLPYSVIFGISGCWLGVVRGDGGGGGCGVCGVGVYNIFTSSNAVTMHCKRGWSRALMGVELGINGSGGAYIGWWWCLWYWNLHYLHQ